MAAVDCRALNTVARVGVTLAVIAQGDAETTDNSMGSIRLGPAKIADLKQLVDFRVEIDTLAT
jgi:hypothetical protein